MRHMSKLSKQFCAVFVLLLTGAASGFAAERGEKAASPSTPTAAASSSASSSAASSTTPTVVLNDSSIVQSTTKRVGVNIGEMDYWDNGQILKNLIGGINPGFEPLLNQQIWLLTSAGTTTTFQDPDSWDGVPANYWTGATFTVVQSSGPEQGCTGTISSNTGPNSSSNTGGLPSFTVSNACAAAFSPGDLVVLKKTTSPTPESWWEGNSAGLSASISGGGKLTSDTTDLCATCGSQALAMNASASGSSAQANFYYDTLFSADIFVLMNGTYQISFWAKAAAGSPTLSVNALRLSSGGFNCGTHTPALTSSWAQYTFTCTASESASTTTPGTQQVGFTTTGGTVYLDNVSFQKVGSSSNTSVLRDEVINTLAKYYNTSSGGNGGTFRYWVNQNAETTDNWTAPDYARMPTAPGAEYFMQPAQSGTVQLSLEDYLVICKLIGAEPYLEVPVTISTTDAANLIGFLGGASTTTYGARRAALGQTDPWTSEFNQIHLSFCNECWNNVQAGQNIPWRNGEPNNETYYDYSTRAATIFAAMRGSSAYSATAFDLVLNAQTAINYSVDTAIQRSHPDSIEIEDYTYGNVNSYSSDSALWGAAMVEPYDKVVDPNDPSNFYTSVHDYQSQTACGSTHTQTCKVNVYEWGQGTVNGSIPQQQLDWINAGAGYGVIAALEPLLNIQTFGIVNDSYFALTEFSNSGPNGETAKLWGNVIDMGGATNNVRPQFLAISLVNQSIIGPMYACPISNNTTYNWAGNSQNGTAVPPGIPALQDVPYVYSFCFENGNKRSLVLVNTDLTGSHTLSFSGTNPPAGSVTERQYAPSSLDALNEAPTGTATNKTAAAVSLTSTTLSSPTSITLPAHSVTALDYNANGTSTPTPAATPSFSLASGSYSGSQSVTISDSTSGSTIYYTTNGSAPSTSSTKYSGAITVAASETLKAIAMVTGAAASNTATATYTITAVTAPPPPTQTAATPVFSLAAGSYSGTQSLTITDSTSGASIYYTTNGATPTTSSTKYASPISVSSTETVKAIAVASGFTNSAVASAAYTISSSSTSGGSETINDPSGFTSTSVNLVGGATLKGTAIQLTDGGGNEARAAWYPTPVSVQNFITDFNFQLTNPTADGFTFTLQNNGVGVVGEAGGGLGYQDLPKSVAVKFDLYDNAGEGSDSTGVYTGGAAPMTPATDLSSTGINLHSGDPFHAHIVYNGTTLTLTITDTKTGSAVTENYTVNIPSAVGGNTAYVGFTAGTGGSSSTQQILNWTYGTSAVLTAATPTFLPAAGSYSSAQSIAIADTTAGATIYYTTNGATPTTSSTKYTKPFTVTSTQTVKAIAAASGYSNSAVASATYTISAAASTEYVNYGSAFSYTNLNMVNGTTLNAGSLQLTDGGLNEARAAWYENQVPVQNFTTDFNFQLTNPNADGFTFTLQNAGVGALGGQGASLGYQGIADSVAVKFDLYNNSGEGSDSTGVYTGGAIPTLPATDLSSTGINLHSGDLFHAHITYNGTTLTLTLTDTQTGAAVTENYTVNIPSAVGSNTAYAGFTAGTGGSSATQKILNWTYSSPD